MFLRDTMTSRGGKKDFSSTSSSAEEDHAISIISMDLVMILVSFIYS